MLYVAYSPPPPHPQKKKERCLGDWVDISSLEEQEDKIKLVQVTVKLHFRTICLHGFAATFLIL